jgi:hypothetical protein
MDDSNWISYVIPAVMAAVVVLMLFLKRPPKMKYGEILPAGEMKKKYHLTADRYKPPTLNPVKVPEQLRDLLPLAAKWGIGDDIIRDDFEQKASEDEKQQLKKTLKGRTEEITKWLNSFGIKKPMPEEAACFMYMLAACDEMKLWPD